MFSQLLYSSASDLTTTDRTETLQSITTLGYCCQTTVTNRAPGHIQQAQIGASAARETTWA